MKTLADQVSTYRLGGEPCPRDLELLLTRGGPILDGLGIEISGDPDWAPWADKSYLTEADYRDPDIAANVKAIDDTFAHIRFVARTEQGESIGYWCGPEGRKAAEGPVVYYDTEGQFRLCGARFIEALFFVLYDDAGLEELRRAAAEWGVPLDFASIDDIAIPEPSITPEAFHLKQYERYKMA
jgi:hypothetical protein